MIYQQINSIELCINLNNLILESETFVLQCSQHITGWLVLTRILFLLSWNEAKLEISTLCALKLCTELLIISSIPLCGCLMYENYEAKGSLSRPTERAPRLRCCCFGYSGTKEMDGWTSRYWTAHRKLFKHRRSSLHPRPTIDRSETNLQNRLYSSSLGPWHFDRSSLSPNFRKDLGEFHYWIAIILPIRVTTSITLPHLSSYWDSVTCSGKNQPGFYWRNVASNSLSYRQINEDFITLF